LVQRSTGVAAQLEPPPRLSSAGEGAEPVKEAWLRYSGGITPTSLGSGKGREKPGHTHEGGLELCTEVSTAQIFCFDEEKKEE
jgi:hypothetical protein